MGNIRVHELATELRKSNREVSDRLRKLEIPAKTNLSSISPEDVNRVRVSFGLKPLKIEKPKKKPAAKKPAKKAARKVEKKAAKKPAARKPAKKAAARKPQKPAEKKAVAKKEKAAVPTAKAAAVKPAAKIVAVPPPLEPPKRDEVTLPPKDVPKARVAELAKPAHEEAKKPAAAKKATPPQAKQNTVKPTLRVAPSDRKSAPAAAKKKVYRFVPRGRRGPKRVKGPPSTVAPRFLRVPAGITVKDFAQKAGMKPGDVIRKLMGFGEMLTLNKSMSDEAIKLLEEDLGVEIKIKPGKPDELDEIVDSPEDLTHKAPVVTVMGHVDHGKTLLLDAIRKTDVVGSEMGGITQHIGAYQVTFSGKPITFIDTPGHESFTAMRARGAQITDIAVLVVAADDGVMPQTLEALDHAREAEVPVIVAVNKTDKPDADPHRTRQQLSEKGLIPDDWGGDTVFVDVSAKEGTNIDHLLEMILLVAEMHELKANPDAEASGVVVEAKLEKTRGPVATILVQRGTASIGDVVAVGTAWGRIRAMFDDRGEVLESAGPSQPVEVLGLSSLPMAGDEFRVVEDERKARQITDRRRMLKKIEEQGGPRHVSLENLFERIKEGEISQLKVVLKADMQGSLEAVTDTLAKIPGEEVKLEVIHSGVGGITETDIMLASASDAIVLGFNVRPDGNAIKAAEAESVDISTYQVIYKLTEDVESALIGMLEPIYEEEVTGRVEARETFRVPGAGVIAGSYVLDGEITRNSQVRIIRDGVVVHDGRVASLRRFKDDAKTVSAGFECGVGLEDFQDIKEGDILEAYMMREVPR